MPELPDPPPAAPAPVPPAEHPVSRRPDLVPDAIEEVAHEAADTARSARGHAAQTVHAVGSATGQVRTQAAGQLTELGHAARQDDPRHWRALTACILAAVAAAIDPPILQATSSGVQGALQAAPETAAIVIGVYYVIQAGFMVAGGVLGDLFGIRRVLLIGLGGMLASSVVAAAAPSLEVLIVASIGLSLSTAVVVPLSLAGVMSTFGQRVLPVAIALYLAIQLLASLAAPALSRLLFDTLGPGAIFGPAIIATLLASLAGLRWLRTDRRGERMRTLDALSLGLWSVGMLALVYALMAFAGGWGPGHEAAVILGVLSLLWAVRRLARHRHLHVPELPYRVLGITLFTGAVIALAQSGALLQLSNFLKGVQGYGDLASGAAMAPFALATLIASLATGAVLARRYRGSAVDLRVFRGPITAGVALIVVSLLMLGTLEMETGYLLIGAALAILGAGASIANVPRTDLLFRSVRGERVGIAAGLNGSSFLLGGALGNVAITAMIATSSATEWQVQLVDGGMTPEEAAAAYESAQRSLFLATAHPFNEPSYLDLAAQIPGWDAIFTSGFTDALLVLAAVTAVAALVAFLGLRARPARG
jgi:DHA2 family multidrug resistance protein-like MFS transporter